MIALKHDHPYLYRRVRVKAILFIFLALSLLFATPEGVAAAKNSIVGDNLNIIIPGFIFLIIGLAMLAGLYISRNTYKFLRLAVSAAAGYALFWLMVFVVSFFVGKIKGFFLIGLWSYLTYNLFIVVTDPAWSMLYLLQEFRKRHDGRK